MIYWVNMALKGHNMFEKIHALIEKYDRIIIHQPTIQNFIDCGEENIYGVITPFISNTTGCRVQLWDMGVDYTEISAYELFYGMLYKMYPQEKTSIIFGDLDLTRFQLMQRKDDESILLYQVIDGEEVVIDEFTYNIIVDYLRQVHLIHKDEKMPANESTKMVLIEDDRDEYLRNKNKEYHSQLKNLISSMVNCEGFKYNHSQVWDMKINAFMDSVRRISKIKNADLLLQSGYSGFGVNLKDINKKQLDWLGELE